MALTPEHKAARKAFREFLKNDKGQYGIYLNTLIKAVEDYLAVLIRDRIDPLFIHVYSDTTDIYKLFNYKVTIEEHSDWAVDAKAYSALKSLDYYIEYMAKRDGIDLASIFPTPQPTIDNFDEGKIYESHCTCRERDPHAREACLREYGYKCRMCGFDFESVYGEAGKGFIEVHHLNPISNTDGEYSINHNDLIPICSNCHSIIHRKKPDGIHHPYTVDEMRNIIGHLNG